MAFFHSEKFKSKLLDNSEFKTYRELEPHIREAVQAFFSAKYVITLGILERHLPDFIHP
jgi:COP9 signalosome complex subunit 1